MKNYALTFVLAVLVVFAAFSLKAKLSPAVKQHKTQTLAQGGFPPPFPPTIAQGGFPPPFPPAR